MFYIDGGIGQSNNSDKMYIKVMSYGDHFVPLELRDWSGSSKVENNGYLRCSILMVVQLQIGWSNNSDKMYIKVTSYGDHFVPLELRDWSSSSKVENNGYLQCLYIGGGIAPDWLVKQF